MATAAGDKAFARQANEKIDFYRKKYDELCEKTGLQPMLEGMGTVKSLTNSGGGGIIGVQGGKSMLKVNTGGKRNEKSLSKEQIESAVKYAAELGMPADRIYYVDYDCTAYGISFDVLRLGTDLYPSLKKQKNPNSNVSMKGAIAHEIVGHRNAAFKGWTQHDDLLEEAQASIRAAKFAPNISRSERVMLIRDAINRLHNNEIKLRDVKHLLNIKEA